MENVITENFNKNEWVNDLIESISVLIQSGLITTVLEIKQYIANDIDLYCTTTTNAVNVCKAFNTIDVDEYEEVSNDDILDIIFCAKTKLIECVTEELDLQNLLSTNTIIEDEK